MSTMAGRRRGINKERAVKERLQAQDWWVCRAAGSFGDADLVALRDGSRPRLIQVKATAHMWDGFGPAKRAAMKKVAEMAGADPWLYWWPKWKREPIELRGDEWPVR